MDEQTIWAGTDDGLIHVTRDGGKTWSNVTPPELKPWMKVSLMDASHFDANDRATRRSTPSGWTTCEPHIYRTRDGGKTWTHITNGIPDGGVINVVREDPKRRGLLFAGSEQAVYVSFDDGGALAVAAAEHAGDVDSRSRDQGRRPGGRHARAQLLDSGRHHAAAAVARGAAVGRRTSVHAAGGDPRALEHEHATRRCRRTNRRGRTRPMARSSTTGCLPAPAARSRSTSWMAAGARCAPTRASRRRTRRSKGATRPITGFAPISHS